MARDLRSRLQSVGMPLALTVLTAPSWSRCSRVVDLTDHVKEGLSTVTNVDASDIIGM